MKSPLARTFHPVTWEILSGCLLLLLVGLIYSQTLKTPWVYDDLEGIRHNPAISSDASFAQILTSSPADSTPYGRPLVVLSLAANHAVSGFAPWSYRVFNLALHVASALLLYDLLRKCLATLPALAATQAARMAFWSATLFALHPLATSVVTYSVQRAEGLMACLYLGTLAAAARALAAPKSRFWPVVAVALCALGMLAKETMATAPLAVLILHRCGFATSWTAVGRRWRWYLGLAATWTVLAICMATWPRRQSVGFGFEAMGALDYLGLQTGAWWHYLLVLVAPWRSAIDYWPAPVSSGQALATGLPFVALYLGLLVWLGRRQPLLSVGLLLPGLILLPTSTIIPIFTSPVADHRMYLPAAFAISLAVAGVLAFRCGRNRLASAGLALCAGALALGTVRANRLFQTERAVWENAVKRDAGNPRAWNNLGMALANEGRHDEGEKKIVQALQLRTHYADAWYNLGTLQGRSRRLASAEESFRRALALRPAHAAAHCNLAVVLSQRGRRPEAIRHYEEAIRLRPGYPAANFNLAVVHLEAGDHARALPFAQACLQSDPAYPRARELMNDLTRLVGNGRGG